MERLTLSRDTKLAVVVAIGYLAWDTVVAILAHDWVAAAVLPGLGAIGVSVVIRARNQRLASDLLIALAILASIALL